MATMLRLKDVSAGYGGFQALFGVSLEIAAGEAIAVIGPNGAGKTTLLRAISKLIPVTQGTLEMEGRSYGDLPAHEIISLGIAHVPEGRKLFARQTVYENLLLGAYTRKNAKNRPGRERTLIRHIRSFFGDKITEDEASSLIENLRTAGYLHIDDKGKLAYHRLPSSPAA